MTRTRLSPRRHFGDHQRAFVHRLLPLAVLGRGYALATDVRGRVLRSARGIERGEDVRVRLAEGALRCRVEEVEGAGE